MFHRMGPVCFLVDTPFKASIYEFVNNRLGYVKYLFFCCAIFTKRRAVGAQKLISVAKKERAIDDGS